MASFKHKLLLEQQENKDRGALLNMADGERVRGGRLRLARRYEEMGIVKIQCQPDKSRCVVFTEFGKKIRRFTPNTPAL